MQAELCGESNAVPYDVSNFFLLTSSLDEFGANFERPVLGCIETNLWKSILVGMKDLIGKKDMKENEKNRRCLNSFAKKC